MYKFLVIACAICFLQAIHSESPPEIYPTLNITELSRKTEDVLQTLHKCFLDFWGVTTNEELSTKIQIESKKYISEVEGFVTALQEKAKSGSGPLTEFVTGITKKINENLDELKSKDAELFTSLKDYEEKFESTLNNVLTETGKLGERLKEETSEIGANLSGLVKNMYDKSWETAQSVQSEVESSVKDKKTK